MTLAINDTAPDFEAQTTEGKIKFHDWIGDKWVVLFSHPKDFTPVCTTELGYMAKIKPEFDKRGVKIIGLSVDPIDRHAGWAADIKEMICEVGEGTVHRLWEPLADKQRPPNGYSAKFSTPYCVAAGFVRGNVGLSDFSDAAVRDPAVVALAGKVRYRIDPQNPYPKNFTGHIRATLRDGTVIEERQPYMRGGAQEPLTRADIQDKFLLNVTHGGWTAARAAQVLQTIGTLFDGPVELTALRD